MELPTDIIDYLSPYLWKTIKPKRYTLLNKRCRDFYYAKNGVYLDLSLDHEITLLCYKYDIHINITNEITTDYLAGFIYRLGSLCSCVVSVKTKKQRMYPHIYILIRKSFPHLKKFKCCMSVSNWSRPLLTPPILGTLIRFDNYFKKEMLMYADLGYKFYLHDGHVGELPDKINQSVVKLKTDSIDRIMHFPNLRTLKHISVDSGKKQESLDKLVEHPSIAKIYTESIIGPLPKNSIRIKYKCYSKNIESLSEYDIVKKYYDKIYVHNVCDAYRLKSYEKETTVIKKMYLEITCPPDKHNGIDKLLRYFNIILHVFGGNQLIDYYIDSPYEFKIKSIRPTKLFRFSTDNGKLYIYVR